MKRFGMLITLFIALCRAETGDQHAASVIDTMDGGGYTYMKVAEGSERYWVAVTAVAVHKGQQVHYIEQMWMPQFKSRALNRTFDKIMFASMADTPGLQAHPEKVTPANAPETVLKKAAGGYSVAEVYARRQALKGKTVRVRGKVTKVSSQIMKRNWVHIEDGTGDTRTDDLVFTAETLSDVRAGDIVTASGTVAVDRDFGYGYFYPVIIENSTFVKER